MTNYTQGNDQLYRYLFKDRAVRGEWVRLNQTFNDTLNTHHYPQAVRNLLGEMMVATALLTAILKFNGDITVQIQGDGPLKLALVNGNNQQQIRALARLQGDIDNSMSLHQMIGKGVLVITIARKEGERYQGMYRWTNRLSANVWKIISCAPNSYKPSSSFAPANMTADRSARACCCKSCRTVPVHRKISNIWQR